MMVYIRMRILSTLKILLFTEYLEAKYTVMYAVLSRCRMKYKLPLFFVCVCTNVGYSAIAQFIVQQEGANEIQEALEILKQWNPS